MGNINLNGKTLQDWFYENNLGDFPDGKDYISYYKTFKDFMDREIHPEIKPMLSRENPPIYLNDHSEKHVAMVIDKISNLLRGIPVSSFLSPYETFLLLTAIQIHDSGHITNANRNTHAEDSDKIIQEFNKNSISALERKVIYDIARAHSGKNDLIGSNSQKISLSETTIRFRLLAALLRLGDELADGRSRASNYLLDNDKIPEESKIYHAFSSCLDTFKVEVEHHEVCMVFCLNKIHATVSYKKGEADQFLINEIYLRSLKTFNECIYYNRFVPEEIRIESISVEILFLNPESTDYFYSPIKYRIEEKGYPSLTSNNIFEVCENDLIKDGIKLDGEYVCNQLINA